MTFFLNPEISINDKLLELLFMVMGFMCLYVASKHLKNWRNPLSRTSFFFWGVLGTILAFGRFIPSMIVGILILLMTIPAIGKKVVPYKQLTHAKAAKPFKNQGPKIFIPATMIGIVAILCSLFTSISSLVGIGLGVIGSLIILHGYSKKNTLAVFLEDGSTMLENVGPLSILPMLLASLGVVYTQAGVGDVIAAGIQTIVPKGNLFVGVVILAAGMVIFTMLMGNSFASITVMLVGVGYPFLLSYGVDPVIGMVALSCGSCGTLMTPMAANFNIVPVTILEMKDNYGVIKNQIVVALCLFVFQVAYMYLLVVYGHALFS